MTSLRLSRFLEADGCLMQQSLFTLPSKAVAQVHLLACQSSCNTRTVSAAAQETADGCQCGGMQRAHRRKGDTSALQVWQADAQQLPAAPQVPHPDAAQGAGGKHLPILVRERQAANLVRVGCLHDLLVKPAVQCNV